MGNKKKASLSGGERVREYTRVRKYSRPKSAQEAKSYSKRSVAHAKPEASITQSTSVAAKKTPQAAATSVHSSAKSTKTASRPRQFSLGSSVYGDYASTDPKYLPKYDMKHSKKTAMLSDNQIRVSRKAKQVKKAPHKSKAMPQTQPVNMPRVNLQLTPAQLAQWQQYMRTVAQARATQASRQATATRVPAATNPNSSAVQIAPSASVAKTAAGGKSSKVLSIQSGDSEALKQRELLKKQKKQQKKAQKLEKRTKKREIKKAEKARPRDRLSFSLPIPKPVSKVHRKTKHHLKKLSEDTPDGATAKRKTVMYAMASVLFAIGLSVSVNGFMTNQKVDAQIKQVAESSQTSTSQAKDKKPTKKSKSDSKDKKANAAAFNSYYQANYSVPANLPKQISIPALGVNASIIAEGVDSEGALIAPDSIYTAGWYNRSALPGNPGGMLIEGHSGIGSTHGIFHDLHKLKAGDQVTVTRGDGKQFTYTVVKQKIYDIKHVDMASMMVSQDPSKPGLNMISCAGDVIPGTLEFNQRIIVYAVMK